MASPVDVRLDAAQRTPTGFIVPSGVRSFREALRGPQAITAFGQWRQEAFTQKLYLALQDLIVHQPKEAHDSDLLVQYGITQGLILAQQLIADPSVLWPDVYGEGQVAEARPALPERPPETFDTPSDSLLDEK